MTILNIVREALRLAASHKPLWLFGFFVALGSSANGGGRGGNAPVPGVPGDAPGVLLMVLPLAALGLAALLMRLLSEGALIEGVKRAARGEQLTIKEGFREGWAHIGPVFLIKVAYTVGTVLSLGLLAVPCLITARLTGIFTALVTVGIPTVLVAVPWLITLYVWHAFALRIAVLENRRVVDAIRKARLFLHGRLLQGLKLMVATLVGTLAVVLGAVALIAPLALLIRALGGVAGPVVVVPAVLALLPVVAALAGILGTYQSSVWTLGYLRQVGR